MKAASTTKQRPVATAKRQVLATASVSAMILGLSASQATAQTPAPQAAQGGTVEEIVVTGTRVVRDGYEAPTPLTVVGADQIESAARPSIADFVNTLPALSGSATPQNSSRGVSAGSAGLNFLNLRNLGSNRTLVLLDGQRSVGSQPSGETDINNIPQGLVSRVDIVTGGASAAYGSDALSGVVNFILDKKFVGVKGEVSGGVTTYGDDRDFKISLTAGTGFSGDRGHFLLSAEDSYIDGVALETNRAWNHQGWELTTNPAYGTGPGLSTTVPLRLLLPQLGLQQATLGGLITAGPLKGIAFGPGGAQSPFVYGSIVGTPFMQGGQWAAENLAGTQTLDPRVARQSVFTRLSYDITDSIEVFAQVSWNYSHAYNGTDAQEYALANQVIKADNAFIPANIRAQMTALKLTSLTMGSLFGDLPVFATDNTRYTNRYVVGASGKFDALDTGWTWDAYYQNGRTRVSKKFNDRLNPNTTLATDSVINPATGAAVCRSTLTNPTDGCVPWNFFGTGVNSKAAVNYLMQNSVTNVYFTQSVMAATVHGEPFSDWVGPVSTALGVEHRTEGGGGKADANSAANIFFLGTQAPILGAYNVTEGFVEVVAPLAKDTVWAKSLDLNAAVRGTSYSTSGYVTTWKVGATYNPIDDIRFRATRSRDIRAPNRSELFASSVFNTNIIIDPFRNNISAQYQGNTTGNINLKPESADTTGLGVVLTPQFFPGFSASFDYYNIDIGGAIGNLGAQAILDRCYAGDQTYCAVVGRNALTGALTQITIQPFNLVQQIARGYDIEASYRTQLDTISSNLGGDLTLRFLATHYIKNYTSNGVNIPTDTAGSNATNGPPHWRYLATIAYSLDPVSMTLTGRGVSAGVYANSNIECSTACPVSTTDHITVNNNQIDGAFYFDLSLGYKLKTIADNGYAAELFLNIQNLVNSDPPIVAHGPAGVAWALTTSNPTFYDTLGRRFHAGVRFKM